MAERNGLSINIDVIESIAGMAALEVNGVSSMAAKRVDIKNALAGKSVFKPVSAEVKNGAVVIDLYICIAKQVNAKKVAEEVQVAVKDRVQSMTGNAVTKINVYVAAVDLTEKEDEE